MQNETTSYKDTAVYKSSLRDAKFHDEVNDWRESYMLNCDCARAIERAINENYKDNRLGECAKSVIDLYGFERVNWVLKNTVQRNMEDGRYSAENKEWAKDTYLPHEDERWQYEVKSHPGLVDLFVKDARNVWNELGLYDKTHCSDEENYENRVLILRPSVLKDEYKTPENQLFYAQCGNGCDPDAIGTKVFGFFLSDGEETNYRRANFIGVMDDKFIPDWAKEKLAEIESEQSETQDETPTQNISM